MSEDSTAVPDISEQSETAQGLCLSCGFCCDGTLFAEVPLKATDDPAPLAAARIVVWVQGAQHSFQQPCPAHDGQCCRIYADRPTVCRNFRCKLLAAYRNQRVSWSQAREKVQQVFALKQAIQAELQRLDPALARLSLRELRKWNKELGGETDGAAFRRKYGAVLIRLAALHRYLQQHFLWDKPADTPGNEDAGTS